MSQTLDQLHARLDECMNLDRRRLRARLRSRGVDTEAVARDIERSIRRREERRARAPKVLFPVELPVCEKRDEIARLIAAHQVIVLCGETGSGKTTQLPKICLELGRGVAGLIGHTQPRRIAARAVAARLAEELGTRAAVGAKVRFNDETSPDNYIKVMTDGILLAETQGDRDLEAYDTIIIDEAHERSLNIDFLLGYLRQLLPRRPDLKVIVTSATIDPERFAAHFADAKGHPAPIIEVSGRVYPVEVRYRPPERADEEDVDEDEPDLQEAILRAVDELASPGMPGGDVLIFLSGEREIRETAENLNKHHPASTQVLPLYARLSADEQQRVFRVTPGVRRIILATNVAETSLTVPGIRYVIDPGFARISRYSPRTKVQRLPIEKVSRASADQRKGRCGRIADGVCIRLYSEKDYEDRPRFTEPEILRTNLAAVILQMASLRLGRVDRFPFIEPPDPRMVRDGYDTLVELGAITEDPGDAEPRLTEVGRRLSRLPVDPRIGRMILAAEAEGCLADMLIVAAALSVQDPRERPVELAEKADQAHALFADPSSDFVGFLKLWKSYHERSRHLTGSKLRKWCKEHFISFVRMREWHDVHSQLKELAGEIGLRVAEAGSGARGGKPERGPTTALIPGQPRRAQEKQGDLSHPALHRALLAGLLSSIGTLPEPVKHAANRFEYQGPRGLRFNIFPGSGLFRKNPKWLVAAEIVKTTKNYARTVAAVRPEWIEHAGAHLLKRTYLDPHWDEPRAQVRAGERITLFGLELVPARGVHYGPINPKASRDIFIHHALVEGEYWSNQPFAKHNQAIAARVDALQHRLRTRDFVLDAQARFEFFDRRLPAEVFSGQTFEAWLRGAQRENPRVLFMSMGDFLRPGCGVDPATLGSDYPDEMVVGEAEAPIRLSLEYRYEPGHAADGVTLVVPLPALGYVTAARIDWLVPGMVEEKLVALIRTLPKDIRRLLVPAPDFAERALALMNFGQGAFLEEAARALGRLAGVAIEVQDFDLASVPTELKMNVRVVEAGVPPAQAKALAEGRDIGSIQLQMRGLVQASLATEASSPWNRVGISDWDFDELPSVVTVERGGLKFPAYPGLVDRRENARRDAGLRLFDSRERAERATRSGLRRLFATRAREEIRWHLEHAPEMQSMLVAYGPIGSPKELAADLADLTAQLAFMEGHDEPIRAKQQFESRLESGWSVVAGAAGEAVGVVRACLNLRHALALKYPEFVAPPAAPTKLAAALHPSASDIRLQMSMLLGPGFVASTPWEWMRHLPRYLQAVERRVQRLLTGGAAGIERDRPLMDAVRPYWVAYLDRARLFHDQGREEPRLNEFRWLIEEFRVSLFAQELGTVASISSKRLDKKWSEIQA
ncbi:MAG: ATP-dependent RNA helicase HrpA [Phycisphaerae bacterium]|nr:ATP-dependent RNA helicase HrpA [Phycisphaerae bacterium]